MCDSPFFVLPKAAVEKVPVDCGRCPKCKRKRVNSWVFRMLQQQEVSLSAHFVTLTYDTRTVPISSNGFLTLRKRDFQLYMKRLRKLCPNETLKYYAVGEYGTNNRRPHYHAIIFNVPELSYFSEAWELGAVHIGQVSGDSIAYTMKYIDKLNYKPAHARDDREPEFPLMSKGLGSSYLSPERIAYHKADLSRMFCTKPGGHTIALPRYYRNKIYDEREQRIQSRLAQSITDQQEIVDRREFSSLNYPDSLTYEAWKDSKRFGRYKTFYSSQFPRDI